MDATTNFLTAPASSPRGNEASGGAANGEISPSGAQFAGVLNGQMLRLERQALASSQQESADLQVLRLGNKLNVITTDAPLPDLASLADFARAQGLGESAVQALFGAPQAASATQALGAQLNFAAPNATVSATFVEGNIPAAQLLASDPAQAGMPQALAAWLPASGQNPPAPSPTLTAQSLAQAIGQSPAQVDTAQAALALAQASAKAMVQAAASQDGVAAMASQNWLNLRAQSAAAASLALSADRSGKDGVVQDAAAASAQAQGDTQNQALDANASDQAALRGDAQPAINAWLAMQNAVVGPAKPADPARAIRAQSQQDSKRDAAATLDAAAAIDAAVQAGLGLAPLSAPGQVSEAQVTVTSLSVEKSGNAKIADTLAAGAATQAAAQVLVHRSAASAMPAAEDAVVADPATPADLQILLVPPDQNITRRLAQLAGQSKPIDWSALLAGQKVSDTLAGLAKSPAPALSDAQAALVAQMQANAQLPASGDEARNALLAKLQAQASRLGEGSADTSKAAGTTSSPAAGASLSGSAPAAPVASSQTLADTLNPATGTARPVNPALLAAAANATQPLQPAPALTPWESLRIEIPSGLVLEALQARKALLSEAEPALPEGIAAPAAQAVGSNNGPMVAKAEAATPQALAEQRAAQYQQVADQLGEAMARRLMAQIERGQWKMQMRMQPASLGRIDVQLDMHAKGLDATFSSDNAVTRELMAQGSARLRDTLAQTGTTVASVVVNGDSGRQSGGNSTPGQKPKGEQNANGKKATAQIQAPVAAMPPTASGDGLNVLA